MRRLLLLTVFVFPLLLAACDREDKKETPGPQPTAQDKILMNYPWRLATVTDTLGKDIPFNQLNTQTRAIKEVMDIQFLQNNTTKAFDQKSKQVINGGTWYLREDSKILDVSVTGFSGKFGIEELTNSRMRLKSTMPVNGVDQSTIMVFQPVI